MTWIQPQSDWLGASNPNLKKPKIAPGPTGDLPAVDYVPVRCPKCKTTKCPAYTSAPPVRYHRCENGHNFKSVEK